MQAEKCNVCFERLGLPVQANDTKPEPMCLACYEKRKATYKDYKLKVEFTEWVFDDDEESAIKFLRERLELSEEAEILLMGTRPIKWSSPWDAKILQLREAVKNGDFEAAKKLAEEM